MDVLTFADTAFNSICDSPIRVAKNCSLLETEGEATGVSVASDQGNRIGAERADAGHDRMDSQRVFCA